MESGSTTSFPSGPLPTDTAEKLDESFSSSEAHGLSPSTVNNSYLFFFQSTEPVLNVRPWGMVDPYTVRPLNVGSRDSGSY